jgi:hypothetical protein
VSGPITGPAGTSDGVTWHVELFGGAIDPTAGGGTMIVPPAQHWPEITAPPSYYTGPRPYYGDWQMTPSGFLSAIRIVIGFDKPIKQARVTAQYVSADGLAMYAVKDIDQFVGIGGATFLAMKSAIWNQNTSGTRTITVPEGFQFIVFQTLSVDPSRSGQLFYGPTFRNFFFFEEIPVPPVVEVPSPDLALPPGAGRTLSQSWPSPGNPNATVNTFISARQWARSGESFGVSQLSSGAPGGGNMVEVHGRQALQVICPSGAARWYVPPQNANLPYAIYTAFEQPSKADVGILDDFLCWRVSALLAFVNPAAPMPDGMGLVIAPFGLSNVRGTPQHAGIFLGCSDDSTIRLSIRQATGGPLTYDVPLDLGAAFDVEHWHKYELRIIGATLGGDAVLKVLVDGEVRLTIPWGVGTILPPPYTGTAFGFQWVLGNFNGALATNTMYLAAQGLEVHAAATEAALL